MLQASRDLLEAARKGQVQDVKALLLNGADPEARNEDVSYSSCVCIFGIDIAYIACALLLLIGAFSGSECHVHL
jgi:ankyrin repeat protein